MVGHLRTVSIPLLVPGVYYRYEDEGVDNAKYYGIHTEHTVCLPFPLYYIPLGTASTSYVYYGTKGNFGISSIGTSRADTISTLVPAPLA
jgi:hypothetical protein